MISTDKLKNKEVINIGDGKSLGFVYDIEVDLDKGVIDGIVIPLSLIHIFHDQGADVIFQVAGNTGNGVFAAAKEAGFYAIGVDQDQKISASEYDEQIICSMKKEVGNSVYDTIKAFIEDENWEGARIWTADMSSGYISIAYGDENSTQQISEELKAEVEEIAASIVAGEIKVETTRQ